ncbi:MAG: DUF3592 domain-containing protein [Bacteroidia bacterium]|nr:DUF3592 domain-containing protein [Bacteroidia bacterium]
MGWSFFNIACLIFLIFASPNGKLFETSTKEWDTVEGVIQKIEPTTIKKKRKRVYRITSIYLYKGKTYENIYHIRGNKFNIGQSITIKVNPNYPNESTVLDVNKSFLDRSIALFSLVFSIPGTVIILISAKKNKKSRDLLLYGHLTRGKIKEKQQTNQTFTINNVRYPVYKYVFEFEYMGKTYETHVKTHKTSELDEEREKILFNPHDPSENVLYDSIPAAPRLDEQGNFVFDKKSYRNLILPFLGIGTFVFWVLPALFYIFGID